jgi:hypothetical protein
LFIEDAPEWMVAKAARPRFSKLTHFSIAQLLGNFAHFRRQSRLDHTNVRILSRIELATELGYAHRCTFSTLTMIFGCFLLLGRRPIAACGGCAERFRHRGLALRHWLLRWVGQETDSLRGCGWIYKVAGPGVWVAEDHRNRLVVAILTVKTSFIQSTCRALSMASLFRLTARRL